MQNYNTIIGVIQMRQDNCPSRSIMGALQDRLRNREPDHKPLCIKRFISSAAPADVTQRRGKYLLSTEKFAA